MKFPIFVEGDICMDEVAAIFRDAGYQLVSDGAGRMVARRVPVFLRKPEPQSNVARLPARVRKVAP